VNKRPVTKPPHAPRPAVDAAGVQAIAALAKLRLTDAEVSTLAHDMAQMLAYVRQLDELDTAEVAPTTHAVTPPRRLRSDEARAGLAREARLVNAPEPIGDGFGVPRVIE